MHQVFMARQPIYDSELRLQAYEVLYRASAANQFQSEGDAAAFGARATARLILNAIEIGIERVTGHHPAFLNLTEELLLSQDFILPTDWVVLEILETVEPTPNVVGGIRRLKEKGYRLALDDFENKHDWSEVLPLVDYVKLDVMALGPERTAALACELRSKYSAKLLAEKVETQHEFEEYKRLGFELFQGYFFARPKMLRTTTLPNSRVAVLRLLAAMQSPTVELSDLDKLIRQDVALSYRLLRYINTPYFSFPTRIESVKQAVTLLGLRAMRNWITLLSLASIDDKPIELLGLALSRARMCETLGQAAGVTESDGLFTAGLFSLLDAMMDAPLDVVLRELSLSDDLTAAILHEEGYMGRALAASKALEEGNTDRACALFSLPALDLSEIYLAAVEWSDLTLKGIAGKTQ